MSTKEKYALSDSGVRNIRLGTTWTVITNLVMMGGVSVMFLAMQDLLATMTKGAPFPNVVPYLIGLLIFIVLYWLSNNYQYYYTYGVVYRESKQQRVTLGERLRKLPLSFFGKRDVADLTETIMTDTTTIEHVASHVVPELYGALISTAIISVTLFFFNWQLALAAVWSVPIAFTLMFLSRKILTPRQTLQREQAVAVSNEIQNTLETMREIRSTNQEETFLSHIAKKIDDYEHRTIVNECIGGLFMQSGQIVMRLGFATTILVGALLIAQGSVDFLTMFVFLLVVSRIYAPFDQALMLLFEMFASHASAERMNNFASEPIMEGSDTFQPKNYDIVFKNVSFSYQPSTQEEKSITHNQVLTDVSFVAREGEVTALVGSSGSGKSTCSKLAARFWDVDSGEVSVGGINIASIDPETLLRDYAVVFQDVLLFNESILENIRLGRRDATDEEVLAAAKAANCDEFAHKLPNGYNTLIGENGSKLSGGERQRISIARALLKNAPIVLLDEATASLDVENETQVQTALSHLLVGKTVLVIAHRMRTVMGADKIVVLKDGTVAEQGSPKDLMERPNGVFHRMVTLQTQSKEWAV